MCFLTVNEHVTGNGDAIHKGTYCVGFLTVNENMRNGESHSYFSNEEKLVKPLSP